MSFSALLGKITKDKKLEEKAKVFESKSNQSPQPSKQSQSNKIKRTPSLSLSALSSISYPQEEDPAVARLKEARRLEKEKQLAIKNAKYGTKLTSSRKQSTSTSTSTTTTKQRQQTSLQQQRQKSPPLPPPPPKSRFKFKPLKHNLKISATDVQRKPSSHVSFSQLMEQASKIENPLTATSFHFVKKPQSKQPSKAYQSLQKSRSRQTESAPTSTSPASSSPQPSMKHSRPTFAKPNPELLKRLQKKQKSPLEQQRTNRQTRPITTNQSRSKPDNYDIDAQDEDDEFDNYDYNDYDEYEDDGFIVDDNEDDEFNNSRQREYQNMRSKGYSKDEIWSIFNRGRKRDYDDYDDYSDMEATGTEILEEEDRTLKAAKLDDLREQKLLEEKAREKRKRLKRL